MLEIEFGALCTTTPARLAWQYRLKIGAQVHRVFQTADTVALEAELQDPSRKRWLADLLALSQMLGHCVINQNYKTDAEWLDAIVLTDVGEAIVDGVMRKNKKLRDNEVRLQTFLTIGSPAGLLVDFDTDVEKLRSMVSAALLGRAFQLPYIYGRELHDHAAERYPEQTRLDNQKSISLLRLLPIGVFQTGFLVSGPFGLLRSRAHRRLDPTRSVPGYYCSDLTCRQIHSIQLATSKTAPISRAGRAVDAFLLENFGNQDETAPIIGRVILDVSSALNRIGDDAIIDAIADGLSLEEVKAITGKLLRERFRQAKQRAVFSLAVDQAVSNPTDFVDGQELAGLLQILLMHSDEEISNAIDLALASRDIEISDFEVRTHRFNRARVPYQAEIGVAGLRVRRRSSEQQVTQRMFELLQHLFVESGVQDVADLRYLVGDQESRGSDELLAQLVHTTSPESIIDEVLLSTRASAAVVAQHLWIANGIELSREELRSRVLWRLGVIGDVGFVEFDRVVARHLELQDAISARTSEETLRGHIAALFPALEDALQRSLSFIVWALTNDHIIADRSFEFDPYMDQVTSEFLDEYSPSLSDKYRLDSGGRNTLVPLAAGFSRLARALDSLVASDFLRPFSQIPPISVLSNRPFAFGHTVPFLDLDETSRGEMLRALSSVSSCLQDEVVAMVRNSTMHGNASFPHRDEIGRAVERVGMALATMGSTGLFPGAYERMSRTTDGFGRERQNYHWGSNSLELVRPRWAVVGEMPSGGPRLVIVPAATLAGVGPLCFTFSQNGSDEYWDGWPRRWRIRHVYGGESDGVEAAIEDASSSTA